MNWRTDDIKKYIRKHAKKHTFTTGAFISISPNDNTHNLRTYYKVMYQNGTGRMHGKRKKRIHLTILMGLDDLCDIRTESSFRIFYTRKSQQKWQAYLIYTLLWIVPFIHFSSSFLYLWQNGNETAFEYISFHSILK